VSVSGTGQPARSALADISEDGRYILYTSSDPLIRTENTDKEVSSLFIYDRDTKTTRQLTTTANMGVKLINCTSAAISGDGRFAAFSVQDCSYKSGYDRRDKLYYCDLRTNAVVAIVEANGNCRDVDISKDGRYIAFASEATNLIPDDINAEEADIFVYDTVNRTVENVHKNNKGEQGNVRALPYLSISDDGRYVAFVSSSYNLVANDTERGYMTYVFDRVSKTIEKVVISKDDVAIGLFIPVLSGDGRYITLCSEHPMVSEDNNKLIDVYVYDRQTREYELVSKSINGSGSMGCDARMPFISKDGKYVVYVSNRTNLVNNAFLQHNYNVYLYDRSTKQTQLIDATPSGTPGFNAGLAYVSNEGRYIVFANGDLSLCGLPKGKGSSFYTFIKSIITNAAPASQ